MDGARLMNAVVASGTSAAQFAGGFDTAWLDFTKGLGAPVGAVLAGFARADRRGLALEAAVGRGVPPVRDRRRRLPLRARPHVERLAEDHDNARVLAEGLLELGLRRDRARDQHRHLQRAGRVRRADGRARRAAERHAGRPRPGGHAPRRGRATRSTRRCWRPGTHCYPDRPWQRSVTRAERAPRSGTAAAIRWSRRSAASTRTCRRSASTSGALPGASTSALAASRPARSRRPSSPAGSPLRVKRCPVPPTTA